MPKIIENILKKNKARPQICAQDPSGVMLMTWGRAETACKWCPAASSSPGGWQQANVPLLAFPYLHFLERMLQIHD